jgi:ketose-bisphosphate aldolase
MKQLLDDAYQRHYAVPAFNVSNLEFIKCVLSAANDLRSPVILQTHHLEADYANARNIVDMTCNLGADMDLKVAIHLDHGSSFEQAMHCIRAGYTSVMFDGSHLPLKQNIEILSSVVKAAHAVGVTVEGELGTIGNTTEFGEKIENIYLSDPEAAAQLTRETGIDCLAVAIGNAHGFYTQEPRLDFDRLKKITSLVHVPIVLHGGTGIPKEQIHKAIHGGISKLNISTALRSVFLSELRTLLNLDPNELELMKVFDAASKKMDISIKNAILMSMSDNKL